MKYNNWSGRHRDRPTEYRAMQRLNTDLSRN